MTEKKTLSAKGRRNKGHSFERLVAGLFRAIWHSAERAPQYTKGRPDVDGTPFWVECKRLKTVTYGKIVAAIRQAEGDAHEAEDDRPVAVVTKPDRGDVLVTMTMTAFMSFIERLYADARGNDD